MGKPEAHRLNTLADIPAVLELAEREAQDLQAWCSHPFCVGDAHPFEWDEYVDAHVALLCDLSRPGSQDAMRRLLGVRYGLDPSGGIILTRQGPAGSKRRDWLLEDWNGKQRVVLKDSPITDPVRALRIALHALAEPG